MKNKDIDEIISGLKSDPKYISSMYFYDEAGSKLFSEITELNEYYLTETEISIIKNNCSTFNEYIGNYPNILEIGAGDGKKAEMFLKCINNVKSYAIVDISQQFIDYTINRLKTKFHGIEIKGITIDFFDFPYTLKNIDEKKVILFLGSTIGNFDKNDAFDFLNDYCKNMNDNDIMIVGIDIKKDPDIILRAYNDSKGVTARFNLNILNNISKILNVNIPENKFEHKVKYDENTGLLEMFLKSKENFLVNINGDIINFKKGELIHTENSFKYSIDEFKNMMEKTGFKNIKAVTDNNKYFSVFMGKKL